jgi:Zn-dependent M32 family carboxypeptidase
MTSEYCEEMVWQGMARYQCSRKAWKDGYCKQHHPDSVAERAEKSRQRSEARWAEQKANDPWRKLEAANARIAELEEQLRVLTNSERIAP